MDWVRDGQVGVSGLSCRRHEQKEFFADKNNNIALFDFHRP
jgi:hypothetical protein